MDTGRPKEISTLEKIVPQEIKIEEAVIAALLLDEDCRHEALNVLNKNCFYHDLYRKIYKVIVDMHSKGEKIDILTVSAKTRDLCSPAEFSRIMLSVNSGAHVGHHSLILYEMYVRRELINISARLQSKAFDKLEPLDEMIAEVQKKLDSLMRMETGNVSTINSVIDEVFKVINRNTKSDSPLIGIGTGLRELDNFTGGIQQTDVVIIAGETSSGKTSLALTIAKNAAMKFAAKVVFYSLEMGKTQLAARLMSQETGISSKEILMQRMDEKKILHISQHVYQLAAAPIFFDDSSSTNINSIVRSIRTMHNNYGINLVVVDYLQLISSSTRGENREQQVSAIARTLKNIAKDLSISIILLSQLNRKDSHKPSISRLRDSGQIEEAADMIIFTYRPEMYGISRYEEPFTNYNPHGTAMIDVAKGRNIGTYQFIATFKKAQTMFTDYDGGEYKAEDDTPSFVDYSGKEYKLEDTPF